MVELSISINDAARISETGAQKRDHDAARAAIERLRAIVQDAHIHLLIGAGTSTGLCDPLGDIENALTQLDGADAPSSARAIARVSLQALFFEKVLWPNVALVDGPGDRAIAVIRSYERLLRALNMLLLQRRSTLLSKRISLFTTNVDLAFELAGDRLGVLS